MLSSKKSPWAQRGRDAAVYVGDAGMQLTESIWEEDTEYDFLNFFLACTALFYIEIDRLAFVKLPRKDRNAFSDAMLGQIIDTANKNFKIAKGYQATAKHHFVENVNTLSAFASELVPEKGASPKGTLYWEFGKFLDDYFADGKVTFSLTILFNILPIAIWLNEQTETLIPA